MKTITKSIYPALAAVALSIGALTANGASSDPSPRPTPTPRPRPPALPVLPLAVSLNGNGQNGGGFIYEYSRLRGQIIFASGLSLPRGVAFDSAGNLFVGTSTITDHCCDVAILKITPDGTRTTFHDDGNNHEFCSGLAIDAFDNVFALIADTNMNCCQTIYKFLPDGTRSTFAGPLTSVTSFGLAFDSAGFLYVAQNFNGTPSQIWKFAPDGTPSLFTTASSPDLFLTAPAFDRFGNLFVSAANNVTTLILKYAPDGTESTFATGLEDARGVAFDNAGILFVAGHTANNILKFTPDGMMTVFASGIPRPEFLSFPRH